MQIDAYFYNTINEFGAFRIIYRRENKRKSVKSCDSRDGSLWLDLGGPNTRVNLKFSTSSISISHFCMFNVQSSMLNVQETYAGGAGAFQETLRAAYVYAASAIDRHQVGFHVKYRNTDYLTPFLPETFIFRHSSGSCAKLGQDQPLSDFTSFSFSPNVE